MGSEYLNNKEFEQLIRLYVEALRDHKKTSEPIDPVLCECVAKCFYLLSDNIIRAFRFSMVEEEDAKQEAVLVCLKKISRFEHSRGKAFNYFTTMILNHYRQLYRSARNYNELKKRFFQRKLLMVPQRLRKGLSWHGRDSEDDE